MQDKFDYVIDNKSWEFVTRPSNVNVYGFRDTWLFQRQKVWLVGDGAEWTANNC